VEMKRQLETRNSRRRRSTAALSIFVIMLVVFLTLLWKLSHKPYSPVQSSDLKIVANAHTTRESDTKGNWRSRLSSVAEPQDRLSSYRDRLRSANSYLSLIADLLPAAESGDIDAQYIVYKSLFYCREEVGKYLREDGRLLAPDEVIQHGMALHASYDYINLVSKRCFELLNSESLQTFGPDLWLAKAAAAGQPAAVAATALRELRNLGAGGTSNGSSSDTRVRDNSWNALMEQIPTADPDVLAYVARAQHFLNTSPDEQRIDGAAWSIVACNAGFDCGPTSETMLRLCDTDSDCEPREGFVQLIEKSSGDDWPKIQTRVSEINARMQAGN
jgi:hypothetical protein